MTSISNKPRPTTFYLITPKGCTKPRQKFDHIIELEETYKELQDKNKPKSDRIK